MTSDKSPCSNFNKQDSVVTHMLVVLLLRRAGGTILLVDRHLRVVPMRADSNGLSRHLAAERDGVALILGLPSLARRRNDNA